MKNHQFSRPCITTIFFLLSSVAAGQVYQQPTYPQPTYQQPTYQQNPVYQQPAYRGQPQQYSQQPGVQRYQTQNYQTQNQQTQVVNHWAQRFEFGKRTHDFGAVPMASKQEHVFEFKNTLNEPIELTSVRTSCGCTKPTVLTRTVQPGGMGKILAKFDTLQFRGKKAATVTVSVLKKQPYLETGEVQFAVKGKIRQDVVLNPGKILFENIQPKEEAQRTVEVKYAGDARWAIQEAKSTSPNLDVSLRETRRDRTSGRVDYELVVKLSKEQPIGMINEQITLLTNDGDSVNRSVAITVEGLIRPTIQSVPIKLGAVEKDSKLSKKLVLRGDQAFEIQEIRVDNQKLMFKKSDGKKTLHILEYDLDTEAIGAVSGFVTVVTDLPGQQETKIPFSGKIIQTVAGGN